MKPNKQSKNSTYPKNRDSTNNNLFSQLNYTKNNHSNNFKNK